MRLLAYPLPQRADDPFAIRDSTGLQVGNPFHDGLFELLFPEGFELCVVAFPVGCHERLRQH